MSWLLADITPVIAVTASAAYWFPVWLNDSHVIVDDMAKLLHIVNLVLLGADMAFSRQPLYFAHAWVPFVYTGAYTLFTWIYFKEGGTDWKGRKYIHSFLDWGHSDSKHMSAAVAEALAIIGIPALYCVMLLLLKALGATGCAWRDPLIDDRVAVRYPVGGSFGSFGSGGSFGYGDPRWDRRLPRGALDYDIEGVGWDRRQRQLLEYGGRPPLPGYGGGPPLPLGYGGGPPLDPYYYN